MPLGRQKDYIAAVYFLELPFVIRAPARRVPPTFSMAWLVYWSGGALATPQTVDICGDAATRGYRLQVLANATVRFSTWNPGIFSVTTGNALVANAFNLIQVNKSLSQNAIRLNAGTAVQAAGTMAAVSPSDNRILGASDIAGTDLLFNVDMAQACMGQVGTLMSSTLMSSTQRAQRLRELPGGTISYLDFGRVSSAIADEATPGLGHFGDDASGARVEALGIVGTQLHQSDRTVDWGTP